MDGWVDGVLNVLKPPGMTSHDVVSYARRVTRIKRVGHTGTLDPGAAGVLPLCLGRATRIAEYLTAFGKAYRVEAVFGISTSTDDSSGEVTGKGDASAIGEARLRAALEAFRGEITQMAPALSAKKHHGVRSYDIVRAGGEPERKTVRVRIHEISLIRFVPGSRCAAVFDVMCSSGTYVRTLCSDIGRHLGVGGYMSFLLRTAAGGFGIEGSLTLEELAEAASAGWLGEVVTSMSAALRFMRGFTLHEKAFERLSHGHAPGEEDVTGEAAPAATPGGAAYADECQLVRLLGPSGQLGAVARLDCADRGRRRFLLEKVISGV
ncbi:MAG: tRNA pseudouridine(55) synthase TruB [Ignavibacteriales bacterium]